MPMSYKLTKHNMIEKLQEKRSIKTADSSGDANISRSIEDSMLELVRQCSKEELDIYMFNDMTDFDIDTTPAEIWEKLKMFNEDFYDSNFKIEQNLEKKNFILEVLD